MWQVTEIKKRKTPSNVSSSFLQLSPSKRRLEFLPYTPIPLVFNVQGHGKFEIRRGTGLGTCSNMEVTWVLLVLALLLFGGN